MNIINSFKSIENPLGISDKFIFDGEEKKPKYTDKHISMMLDEFQSVLREENDKYIESKSYKKFKQKIKENTFSIDKKNVIINFD